MTTLVKYDNARRALAEARHVDEVKEIRDKALAMQAYAKQAKERELIDHATDIRMRAEIRAGEMLAEMAERGERQKAGDAGVHPDGSKKRPSAPKLSDLGVTKTQSSRWQALAALPKEQQDEKIEHAKKRAVAALDGAQSSFYMSDSNEWYTPAPYIVSVRTVLGGIDLDPASNATANLTVGADKIFTEKDDGLKQSWHGRIFLNPPYGVVERESSAGLWCQKAISEYESGNVEAGIILVNSVHAKKWQRPLFQFPFCLVDHRIKFVSDKDKNPNPTFMNMFVYLGRDKQRFADVFSQWGYVAATITITTTVNDGIPEFLRRQAKAEAAP
jgi:DNA N-6-adenine-methyltransferase (Dam)